MSGTGDSDATALDARRRRRNKLLFAVHIVLALAILGAFVYSVAHK